MAITAKLDTVSKTDFPLIFNLGVTYTDSAIPEWHVSKTLPVSVDPALTPQQQRQAIVAAVTADVTTYKQQSGIYAGLVSLEGQSIVIP